MTLAYKHTDIISACTDFRTNLDKNLPLSPIPRPYLPLPRHRYYIGKPRPIPKPCYDMEFVIILLFSGPHQIGRAHV